MVVGTGMLLLLSLDFHFPCEAKQISTLLMSSQDGVGEVCVCAAGRMECECVPSCVWAGSTWGCWLGDREQVQPVIGISSALDCLSSVC